MKKIVFAAALMISGTVAAFAQQSATANLKVNLSDIMTIEVVNPDVTINVTTAQDYINAAGNIGITVGVPGHLKVVSNGGFKVLASSGNLQGPGSARIENDKIELAITGHTKLSGTASNELVGLSQAIGHNLYNDASASLISTSTDGGGTVGTLFNVDYTLKNVTNIANLPVAVYATTVTYTIEAN